MLAVAVFLTVSSEMIPTGLLPEMSASLGVTESQVGFLVTSFAFAAVLTNIPLSILTRRISRHTLVVVVLVVIGTSAALASIAPGYEFLMVARVVGGIAHGVFWSVVGVYSAHLVPKEQIGRAVAITIGGGTVAFVLGVPLGTAIGQSFSWRVPFLAIGVLALAGAVLIWFRLPRAPHFDDAKAASRGVERDESAAGATERAPTKRRFDPTIPAVAALCALVALLMGGHYAFYTYIAPFLIQEVGIPEGRVGTLLFFYGAAGAGGLFLAGSLFGRRPLRGIAVGIGCSGVGVVVFMVFAGQLDIAIAAFVFWGVMFGTLQPLLSTQLLHAASPAIRDTSSAFVSTSFNVGIGSGALLGGLVLEVAGLGALPWADIAALTVAGALLAVSPVIAARRSARAAAASSG
jgi:predicted MFS family arabinose efflux permease